MSLRFCVIVVLVSSLAYGTLAQQPVPTPANIVCYQVVVASQGTYAQINTSLKNWSQKMYQTLGLTGPIEQSVGWARVPDRTGFENNCTGPYPNIADLFVHIQTTGGSNFDSISSALESFIAANRLTSQPNIVCSARSIVTFLPRCGKTGGAGINPGTTLVPPANATTSTQTNATGPSNATVAPTTTPTTSAPTNATSNSGSPTVATTAAPTPSTTAPTGTNPTQAPTQSPTTQAPTQAPTTQAPATETPTTIAPTQAPTTKTPTTTAPTQAPTTTAPTQAPTTQAPTQGPTQAPTTHNVNISNNFYSPSSVTINQGDTVTWTWNGGPHTVTSGTPNNGPDGKFCSIPSNQTPNVQSCSGTSYAKSNGFTYSHTFTTAGTFPYYCAIHLSAMTGSITVNPTVIGGAAMDQSTTGSMTSDAVHTVAMTEMWMSIGIIMSTLILML